MTRTKPQSVPRDHRVVIAGGGVAALEALAALGALAGHRLDVTLLSPTARFALRADAVTVAFGQGDVEHYDIAAIAADHGAAFIHDALQVTSRDARTVLTRRGLELAYDSLLVAVGAHARPHPGLRDALSFGGPDAVTPMRQLLGDVEAGDVTAIAFVVPPDVTWTLPLYELAMLTAERSQDVSITLLTPEPAPVSAMGRNANAAVFRSLAEHGIALRTHAAVQRLEDGRLLDLRGRELARADRTVALPLLEGPRILGLPHDRDGFIPVDELGAIPGVPMAYGAGDATTAPAKQGGLAAQQADVIARLIAQSAGADLSVTPLRPTLRAHAAVGSGDTWFSAPVSRTAPPDAGTATDSPLWWPPRKVHMPHLGAYLEGRRDMR
jgi:sulfide:quinone oxidoreductase